MTKKELRASWKERGFCTNCGSRPARDGKAWCQQCADKQSRGKYQLNRYHRLRGNDCCTRCGKTTSGGGVALCRTCLDKNNTRNKQKIQEFKRQVIDRYGGQCACCGESILMFLSLDHVNNDGGEHRRTEKYTRGGGIYRWAARNDYPKVLQVLCHNCNFGKYLNGGVCPHETTSK